MNREDIIAMAQEAGFREPNPHDGCMGIAYDYRDGTDTGASLERFATLVASAEREACIQIVENEAFQYASPVWAFEIVNDIKSRGKHD